MLIVRLIQVEQPSIDTGLYQCNTAGLTANTPGDAASSGLQQRGNASPDIAATDD